MSQTIPHSPLVISEPARPDGRRREAFERAAAALADELVESAALAGRRPEGGLLWAAAGELREFGLADAEGADRCYGRAINHAQPPAAGFAGARRLARRSGEQALVGDLYRLESESARDSGQAILAAAQRVVWLLHQGADRGYAQVARVFDEHEAEDPWAELLAVMLREDLALLAGHVDETLALRGRRFELARARLDPEEPRQRLELGQLATGVALAELALAGRDDVAIGWLQRAIELVPAESALRELSSLCTSSGQLVELAASLERVASTAPAAPTRARTFYELGMLRRYRLGDVEGAQRAFRAGMRQDELGHPAAAGFLHLVRASETPADPNDMVDALGLQAELASSPRERADCLYHMGLIFDAQLHLPDAAVELLRDALSVCPGHRPAARSLGRLYQRRGAWGLLAELLEEELVRYPDSRRTRLKLAEIYQDRLSAPERAEPHLRQILEGRLHPPALRRLHRLLARQGRWLELHDHLVACARRESSTREQLYELERAAEIAETRLDRPDLAIESWRAIHEIDPLHPGALATLGRLFSRLSRWEDLIELNKDEIAVRDESQVAARLWTRNGELYEVNLNDEERAQQCYSLALEIDPTYEPALEALGRMLWRQRDWDGLVDMYEAEIEACTEEPRRIRRLLDLGELQATLAGRPESALATFQYVIERDPTCEEALLWIERLAQSLEDDGRVLDAIERRCGLVPPEQRAPLHLRAAALAEWALDEVSSAWGHYLAALASPATRSFAVVGLWRLWTRLSDDPERRERSLTELGAAGQHDTQQHETDPSVAGLLAVLKSRIERGASGLDDWLAAAQVDPADPMAGAAVELSAAAEGRVADLVAHRLRTRSGALWSLLAQVDAPDDRAELPRWLPPSTLSARLLAELDVEGGEALIAPDGGDEGASKRAEMGAPTLFRRSVRAWSKGEAMPSVPLDQVSIPMLRLHAHDALDDGDTEEASRFAEMEARQWQDPAHRQRRLTQAAVLRHSTRPNSARALFGDALACNCFDDSSRVALYDALEGCGELELLVDGLHEHVVQTAEPGQRARWLERLAGSYERLGNRERAASAWESILELEPLNAVALLEHVRLLTLEARLDDARVALERALRRPLSADDRLLLLGKLADLHLMDGGDGSRAVAALEEATTLAERTAPWLRRLARSHYGYGSAERAMDLLTEALPPVVAEPDLGDWFLLARLKYLKLDDPDGARELLWGLFEQFPDSVETLRELEAFYRKQGGAADLAERLSTLLLDPPQHLDIGTLGFLWEYIGDLNYQVLRRNRDAQIAYEAAMSAAGDGARLALKVARTVGQQPGKGREASARFAAALRLPDVGVMEWLEAIDDLEALFEGIEDAARVRVMRQIRDLLLGRSEPQLDESRIKRDPARQLDRELALTRLADGLVGPGSLEVMMAIAPIFERCHGHRRARRRALGGRRLRGGDAAHLIEMVDLAAETLQSGAPRVYAGSGSDQPEWLSNGGYWLPELVPATAEGLQTRFWAGHIVGFSAFQLGGLSLAEPGEIETLLSEIRRLELGGPPDTTDPIGKEVSASRFNSARAQVMEILEEHPDVPGRAALECWFDVPVALADRFGLLIAGDVRAAVEALMLLEGEHRPPEHAERMLGQPRPRHLIEFALGFAYQELRYLAGLAGKPKLV